jgi:hypothetical protein
VPHMVVIPGRPGVEERCHFLRCLVVLCAHQVTSSLASHLCGTAPRQGTPWTVAGARRRNPNLAVPIACPQPDPPGRPSLPVGGAGRARVRDLSRLTRK